MVLSPQVQLLVLRGEENKLASKKPAAVERSVVVEQVGEVGKGHGGKSV